MKVIATALMFAACLAGTFYADHIGSTFAALLGLAAAVVFCVYAALILDRLPGEGS